MLINGTLSGNSPAAAALSVDRMCAAYACARVQSLPFTGAGQSRSEDNRAPYWAIAIIGRPAHFHRRLSFRQITRKKLLLTSSADRAFDFYSSFSKTSVSSACTYFELSKLIITQESPRGHESSTVTAFLLLQALSTCVYVSFVDTQFGHTPVSGPQ